MASNGYGMAGHLGLAKESTWGTSVAATDYVEILSESVSREIDRFDVANIVGRLAEPDDQAGVHRFSGDVTFAAHPEPLGYFLLGVMGVQSNTVVSSGTLHKHEFTMRNSDQSSASPEQPFTFEISRDVNSAQQLTGVNISTLEFNVAPNQHLEATASVMAKDESGIAPTSPSYASSPSGVFAFETASLQIGGSANAKFEGFTITMDNQEEGVPALNDSDRVAKLRRTGPKTVRVSGNVAFEDETEYNDFKNQNEQVVKLSMSKADSHEILFDMPRVVFTSLPLGMDGRGRQVLSVDGIARYDTGSNSQIMVTLWNTTSGY